MSGSYDPFSNRNDARLLQTELVRHRLRLDIVNKTIRDRTRSLDGLWKNATRLWTNILTPSREQRVNYC